MRQRGPRGGKVVGTAFLLDRRGCRRRRADSSSGVFPVESAPRKLDHAEGEQVIRRIRVITRDVMPKRREF